MQNIANPHKCHSQIFTFELIHNCGEECGIKCNITYAMLFDQVLGIIQKKNLYSQNIGMYSKVYITVSNSDFTKAMVTSLLHQPRQCQLTFNTVSFLICAELVFIMFWFLQYTQCWTINDVHICMHVHILNCITYILKRIQYYTSLYFCF